MVKVADLHCHCSMHCQAAASIWRLLYPPNCSLACCTHVHSVLLPAITSCILDCCHFLNAEKAFKSSISWYCSAMLPVNKKNDRPPVYCVFMLSVSVQVKEVTTSRKAGFIVVLPAN